jgi:large subunit ribosomal protein L4
MSKAAAENSLKISVYDINGKEVEKISLPEQVFGLRWNADLVHQVMRVKLANKRQLLAHTKDRSQVRGGGTKPWRQKGTGRARHGSIRSPLWIGGGVTFGPSSERNFKKRISKKMNRKAILILLSRKLKDGEIVVIQNFDLESGKTKELAKVLEKLPLKSRNILMGTYKNLPSLVRAAKNIQRLEVSVANEINVLSLLNHKHLVLMKGGVPLFENTFIKREPVKASA